MPYEIGGHRTKNRLDSIECGTAFNSFNKRDFTAMQHTNTSTWLNQIYNQKQDLKNAFHKSHVICYPCNTIKPLILNFLITADLHYDIMFFIRRIYVIVWYRYECMC